MLLSRSSGSEKNYSAKRRNNKYRESAGNMANQEALEKKSTEQIFLDLYKKQSKLTWYTSEKASAAKYQSWNRCYSLALMIAPLPECKKEVAELPYSQDKCLERFTDDSINIAYACSDQFAPFCGVSVYSLISNASNDKNYDILIMHSASLSEINKKHLCALADGKPNISIRIIDCSRSQLTNEGLVRSYYSSEVYYRCLLLTDFFSNYDRFLYLDSDTVVNADVSELFKRNMSGKPIAAATDQCMEYLVNSESNLVINGTVLSYRYYIKNFLKIDNPLQYFNSGVMLLDIKKLRQQNSYRDISMMVRSGKYYCFEQCVFNYLFHNHVDHLPLIWNVQNVTNVYSNYRDYISEKTISHLKWCIPRYKIMHYIGSEKPWFRPDDKNSVAFTTYASGTPWFKTLIYASLTDKAEEFLLNCKSK